MKVQPWKAHGKETLNTNNLQCILRIFIAIKLNSDFPFTGLLDSEDP